MIHTDTLSCTLLHLELELFKASIYSIVFTFSWLLTDIRSKCSNYYAYSTMLKLFLVYISLHRADCHLTPYNIIQTCQQVGWMIFKLTIFCSSEDCITEYYSNWMKSRIFANFWWYDFELSFTNHFPFWQKVLRAHLASSQQPLHRLIAESYKTVHHEHLPRKSWCMI